MPDMPRPRPPRLQRGVSRHGKVVWFVQIKRGAPKIRVRGEYGSDEFNAAYLAAIANVPAPKTPEIKAGKGSLEWAWALYKQSASWQSKSGATRRQRENIMKHVLASAGSQPVSVIDDVAISEGVDRRAKTPYQAKNFAQTMRQFFKWLKKNKFINENPCDGLELPKRPNTGGFKEWNYEEILRNEERWPLGTRERVMLDAYMYTGLRRGDATFLLMAQYNGKVIIPVETVCRDYFSHLTPTKFIEKVRAGEIKLPLVRLGTGQKAAKSNPSSGFG
jgi:Pyocin activator protein PrtN